MHPDTGAHDDIAQDFAAVIVPHVVAHHDAHDYVPAGNGTGRQGPVIEPQQLGRALATPLVRYPVH